MLSYSFYWPTIEILESLAFLTLSIILFAFLLPRVFSILGESRSYEISRNERLDLIIGSRSPKVEIAHQGTTLSPFPLYSLPVELVLTILTFAVQSSNPTFHCLIYVSHRMRDLTYRASLPSIPVVVKTTDQLTSFHDFLSTKPDLGFLVHHLWILFTVPLSVYEENLCASIVNICINLRSLACGFRVLKGSIASSGAFGHSQCRRLTLHMGPFRWESFLETPHGQTYLDQLTHLRVIGPYPAPQKLRFSKLAHLSFTGSMGSDAMTVARNALDDIQSHPEIRTVVLTDGAYNWMLQTGALPIHHGARLFSLRIPRQWNEREIWRSSVNGKSWWDQAISLAERPRPRS